LGLASVSRRFLVLFDTVLIRFCFVYLVGFVMDLYGFVLSSRVLNKVLE
jgi:hypothetical protein